MLRFVQQTHHWLSPPPTHTQQDIWKLRGSSDQKLWKASNVLDRGYHCRPGNFTLLPLKHNSPRLAVGGVHVCLGARLQMGPSTLLIVPGSNEVEPLFTSFSWGGALVTSFIWGGPLVTSCSGGEPLFTSFSCLIHFVVGWPVSLQVHGLNSPSCTEFLKIWSLKRRLS